MTHARFLRMISCFAIVALVAPASAAGQRNMNMNKTQATVTPAAPDGSLGMALLSARVNADASLAYGSGATGASYPADIDGSYEVDFNRDVSRCTYSVSLEDFYFLPGGAEPRSGKANAVYVYITDQTFKGAQASFDLIVYCAK